MAAVHLLRSQLGSGALKEMHNAQIPKLHDRLICVEDTTADPSRKTRGLRIGLNALMCVQLQTQTPTVLGCKMTGDEDLVCYLWHSLASILTRSDQRNWSRRYGCKVY